jgi:hypothetical protein
MRMDAVALSSGFLARVKMRKFFSESGKFL